MSESVIVVGLAILGVLYMVKFLHSSGDDTEHFPFSRNGDRETTRNQDKRRDKQNQIDNETRRDDDDESDRNDPPQTTQEDVERATEHN